LSMGPDFNQELYLINMYFSHKRTIMMLLSKLLTVSAHSLFQINIPKQTEEIHWLSFSPVEEHFYRRTFIDCSKEMVEKLRNFPRADMKLSEMDRKSLQASSL
jgi:hypothetical protein